MASALPDADGLKEVQQIPNQSYERMQKIQASSQIAESIRKVVGEQNITQDELSRVSNSPSVFGFKEEEVKHYDSIFM